MTLSAVLFLLQALVPPERVEPVLEFPQAGLDDPAAYEGYRTRFFRDAHGNAFQVYLNQRRGRVVNLWANASNESVGFTVRDTAGQPARLSWASDGAVVSSDENGHSIEYHLQAEPEPLEIGWFMLGTMRVERDFQHHQHDLQPFGAEPFPRPELEELIRNLERLGPDERRAQLELLEAGSVGELRERLRPTAELTERDTSWIVRVEQPSFDGRNRLALDLIVPRRDAEVEIHDGKVLVRPRSDHPIHLGLRGTTDAAALSPLERGEIFSDEFLEFLGLAAAERDRILRAAPEELRLEDRERLLGIQRLERQVRSVELLSYREKLMAGLPNFATYFGRDMLMTALMMQPIWRDVMSEHVVASVLRKLAPSGEVSHEEALGDQAIRENAGVYNTLMSDYFRKRESGDAEAADSALSAARHVLVNLQAVRENYGNMMDDDFQFPVLVARYLADAGISDERKRDFLREPARAGGGDSRLALLLRNLAYVSRAAEPYARDPVVMNLVGFRQRSADEWFPGSWRDSNAGYGNGRFAMDINVIWVPAALESVSRILPILDRLGIADELQELAPEIRDTPLGRHIDDPASLDEALAVWRGTARHFEVNLSAAEVRQQVQAKLASLPEEERAYWETIFRDHDEAGIEFLALSLDEEGRPIRIVHTDPATQLFLQNFSDRPDRVLRDVRTFVLPYPVGLLVPALGTLVANDTYASPGVWEDFRTDHYHSPRVVWGREVNLVILGIANQINAASAAEPDLHDFPPLADYLGELHEALETTVAAAEASGLKHNELWSYRIEDGRLVPVRYGSSSDIQLWNLTDLAVQYELARLTTASPAASLPLDR